MLSHFIGVPWYLGVIIGVIGLIALHFWDRYQEKKVDKKQAHILKKIQEVLGIQEIYEHIARLQIEIRRLRRSIENLEKSNRDRKI